MKIGYTGISTVEQNLNLQTDALERARALEKVFTDTASGSIDARKGLIDAVKFCRDGDSLIALEIGSSRKELEAPDRHGQSFAVERR